jgi:hypothetical protein
MVASIETSRQPLRPIVLPITSNYRNLETRPASSHCVGSLRGGGGPSPISISASWTCWITWPKVAHVEPLTAARAFHEVVGLGLRDAVRIVALHDRTFGFK